MANFELRGEMDYDGTLYKYECSRCNESITVWDCVEDMGWEYCPYCGVRMEVD